MCLRERTVHTFKSHLELLDDCGPLGSVSEADSAASRLNLYPALFFPASRSTRCRGRESEGARKALISRGAGRVEGQCGREIGAATWQTEAKRDHFLTLSLIRLSFPSPRPSGHLQYVLVISRSTDGYSVHLCGFCLGLPLCRPLPNPPLCFDSSKHHLTCAAAADAGVVFSA